ncbi:MAG TPA: FKBP-type peptidyl-prolyl cis-trans isomerase [Candidatus Polarisedimenticolia bacterium]|nr:FKBP-type peptidyl-prolyl cis-trans isomerase [Candidatus Polarisedimenticolia bacterium]
MNSLGKLAAGIFIGAFLFHSASAQTNSAPNANLKTVEAWGWVLAQNEKLSGIEISSNELSLFVKGFLAGVKNKPLQYNSSIFPDVEQLAKARREKVTQRIVQKNLAQADAFVAGLKQNPNIVALPENVFYEPLKEGSGSNPKSTQTVTVHYTARLLDGTEFYQAGPVDMVLVTNRSLCRGWIAPIEKMKVGGAAKLYVPPPLPEDEAERWGIEPGAMMVFEVELLGVKDTSPDDLANARIPTPPDSPPEKSGYNTGQIVDAWGWSTARRAHLNQLNLGGDEMERLVKGLTAAIRSGAPSKELEAIYPQVEKFVADRRAKARMEARQKRTVEMEQLFAKLKKNPNVVELPDGLRYEIVKQGDGTFPKEGQTVLVNYVGHLIDGSVFDKTMDEPLHVKVGSVIAGWNEGIQKIGKGGKIRLYIPPSLGYGEESVSGIPAGSALIFEVELVDIEAD